MSTTIKLPAFELNKNNDLENVLNFIEQIPYYLQSIFYQESFKEIVNKDELHNISFILFDNAFKEAVEELESELILFRRNITIDNILAKNRFISQSNAALRKIGFTDNSLNLKINIFNKLLNGINNVGNGIIDFASNPIVKAVRKFLNYLNSLLGSLSKFISGIDPIKEIKEIAESYLDLGEELAS